MTILRMCELGDISRAGLYRFDPEAERREEELDLRDAVQRIALEFPCYGRPRITAELRRQGWEVNHKRVGRIMREDNLLCIRRRKFVCTTDSNHGLRVYPNLAGKMELTGLDQLWVADITYIRLETEFIYLAVVLDAFSRRVIGWALGRTLEASLAVQALKMAFRRRGVCHRVDASFRPGRAVRLQGIHGPVEGARGSDQHEPEGQPLRQCQMRILHEDVEIRGGLSAGISRSRRGAGIGGKVH